jgi:4-oxalocrotonate tautomerase
MPTLQLNVSPPQTPERHQALAAALTHLTTKHLNKRAEVTAVMIDNRPASTWFIGGNPIAQPSAWLEISVTQGTNTAQEKAAFIDAAFQELQRQLQTASDQPLALASYVIVREVVATDWGYAGVTQAVRRAGMPESNSEIARVIA